MRLLYLQPSPSFGMHQYTADLANRMSEKHETFLCTNKGYPEDRYAPGISIHTPLDIKTTGFSLEGLRISQARLVIKTINKLKPDVIHISGPHLWNLYWVRVFQKKDIPVIHTIHDLNPHPGMRFGRLLPFWNNQITKGASHILVHSSKYREKLISSGLQKARVSSLPLLHLFLGFEAGRKVAAEMPKLSYGQYILFFGRIKKYKGLDQLVKAFTLVNHPKNEQGHQPFRLLIIGSGSISEFWPHEIPESVEVIEGQASDDEAVEYFSSCSMIVLPYVEGSQSALIASAYYFKKPVLATRVGAFEEYVQHGITGRLIEPNDYRALRDELINMTSDEHSLRTMGEAGRQWYDQQRTDEHRKLIELYEHVRAN